MRATEGHMHMSESHLDPNVCGHDTWSKKTLINNAALRDNAHFFKMAFDPLQKTVLLTFSFFCQDKIANCIFGTLPLSKS